MRIKESQLRRIIRGELLREQFLLEATDDDLPDDDYNVDLDFEEDDYDALDFDDDDEDEGPIRPSPFNDPSRGNIRYEDDPSSPEAKQITRTRRNMKRRWNEQADMSFFQDPGKLVPIHYMGLYSGRKGLDDYFPDAVAAAEQGRQIPRTPGIHVPNRNELSCIGYIQPFSISSIRGSSTFLTFKKYRVTFASDHDAFTERLSHAGPQHRAFYASSGLPKRPGLGIPSGATLLSPKSATNPIAEVVIGNWIADAYCGPASDEEIASKIGLRFIHNGRP